MQAWRQRAKNLGLSDNTVGRIVDNIAYQGDGEIISRQGYGFTAEEIIDMMLDHSYERCKNCRWFVEVSELLGEDDELKFCDDCSPRVS